MQYVWRHIPLFRFLLPLILGILLANNFFIRIEVILILAVFLTICSVSLHFYTKRKLNRKLIQVNSVLLILLLFLGGWLISYYHNQIYSPKHFSHKKAANAYLVRVVNNPSVKPKSVSLEVEVLEVLDTSASFPCIGKAQLFVALDSASKTIAYGDELLVANKLKKIAKPANPYQFDFKKYYSTKNIYHNGFITSDNWQRTNKQKGNPLQKLGYTIQNNLQLQFKQYFKDDAIRGIAQAIVFGYKEELDDEAMEAFSKTGTIHVLAVSGLHVGIIFIMLSFILQLQNSKGRALAIKSAIVLLVLFLYCLITGFSPSVSRASIMFGLVLLGKVFLRQASIYNTLSFACLVLLIANPNNIFNVGFQFSFLAVFGIVFYKDGFRRLLPTSNWLADKIITLLAVSIAAQITTFPLGLYYFHQYPNLFMFSNLIVIPCITVILYGGIFFVGFSYISSMVATLFADGVALYIAFISKAVTYIQNLPFAFFENVYISFGQMLLIDSFIFSLTFAWLNKWKVGLLIPVVCAVGYLAIEFYSFTNSQKTEVISFYHNKETLLMFRKNNQALFLASSAIYQDEEAMKYIITPYLVNEGLTADYDILPMETIKRPINHKLITGYGKGMVWFNGKSYIILDDINAYITDTIKADYLLIGRKKSLQYTAAIASLIEPQKVVFTSNCPKFLENEIKSKKYFSLKNNTYICKENTYIKL